MTWIETMIAEAGNVDILADMLISENSEWFDLSEVLRARRHLTRIGKYKIIEYNSEDVKKLFLRKKQIERKIYHSQLRRIMWDEVQDKIIKMNWNTLSCFDIGVILNRTDGAIRKRAAVLHLGSKTFNRSGKLGYYEIRTV